MTKEELESVKVPDYDKIIVELREKESNSLEADNSIIETSVKGSLRVINPSETPIWNTELSLTGDLSETFLLGLIPGKRAWRYNFEMPPVSPPLELKEEIHTNYQDGNPPAVFSISIPVQQKTGVLFNIQLTNTSEIEISNITLKKMFSESFSEPTQKKVTVGMAKFDRTSAQLSWKIQNLGARETAELHLYSEIEAFHTTPYDAGTIEVQYEIAEFSKTEIIPDITSTSQKTIEIRKEESEDKHGTWNCALEFHNKSNLSMNIENFEIIDNLGEFRITQQPDIIVNPQSSWIHDFEMVSMDLPALKSNISSRVVFELRKAYQGVITKKGTPLPVIAAEIFKSYTPKEVMGLVETPIEVSLLIRNVGSAPLNQISIKDTIPVQFRPPTPSASQFGTKGMEISPDSLQLVPDDEDPTKIHELSLEIKNLQQLTGKIESGAEVTLKYPVLAMTPRPGEYEGKYEIFLNGDPPGLAAHYTGRGIISVKHARRKLICTKTVMPVEVDQFQIDLEIRNEGEIEIKDIIVYDRIPASFNIISFEPSFLRPIETEDEEDPKISWSIDKILPADTLMITYIVKGTGIIEEYEPEYVVKSV